MECNFCYRLFTYRGMSNHQNACRSKKIQEERSRIEQNILAQCKQKREVDNLVQKLCNREQQEKETNEKLDVLGKKVDFLNSKIDLIQINSELALIGLDDTNEKLDEMKKIIDMAITRVNLCFDAYESEINAYVAWCKEYNEIPDYKTLKNGLGECKFDNYNLFNLIENCGKLENVESQIASNKQFEKCVKEGIDKMRETLKQHGFIE